MMFWMIILCVIPATVKTITITPNGHSPEKKMQKATQLIRTDYEDAITSESVQENKKYETDGFKNYQTKLAINERYRRLIPYMTFYYANDLAAPENFRAKNVEVEKAEIIETASIKPNEREPKVIFLPQNNKHIPRYFGNRLTQHNIASSNPSKLLYKSVTPTAYRHFPKITNYGPIYQEPDTFEYSDRTYDRLVPKSHKHSHQQYLSPKPYLNPFQNEDTSNVQYYSSTKEENPTFRLVPYEQNPPVNVIVQNKHNIKPPQKQYEIVHTAPVDQVYIKSTNIDHLNVPYHGVYNKEEQVRKPTTVSEIYYEQKTPTEEKTQPIILESGFKPTIDASVLKTSGNYQHYDVSSISNNNEPIELEGVSYKPTYIEKPNYKSQNKVAVPVTVSNLLNSLQLQHKPIPKENTRNNVGASIRALLQVLNTIKAMPQENPVLKTDKPYTPSQIIETSPDPAPATVEEPEFQEEPYLAPIKTPSQHLDDLPSTSGTSQRFPLPINSDDDGGTPGKPGIDYPILTVIPETSFNCKTQRYKGFFADTETRCQVWHYCDLNGGQASFLCPNGTIFSQAGLTCDWWFNVRCASTAQLYVLNESLYKFILPHSPKFPEDYSGPLVDKYLTLKFKEMEEQFRKNKKKTADEKTDSAAESNEKDEESDDGSTTEGENTREVKSAVQQGHVSVQSAGNSGNVERLHDD